MKNCNLKTLNGEIDNINLPFLDYFKVYYKQISSATDKSNGIRTYPDMAVNGAIKCVGDVYFADSSLVSTGSKEMSLPPYTSIAYITNNNGALLVSKNVTQLQAVSGAGSVDKAYYIKTSEFKDTNKLVDLSLNRTDSVGTILDFVKSTGIVVIVFNNCLEIEGDISKFLETQIDVYGRTSGTISFGLVNTKCSIIPGTPCTSSYTAVITDSTHFSITNSSGNFHWNGTKSGGNWTIEYVVDE